MQENLSSSYNKSLEALHKIENFISTYQLNEKTSPTILRRQVACWPYDYELFNNLKNCIDPDIKKTAIRLCKLYCNFNSPSI